MNKFEKSRKVSAEIALLRGFDGKRCPDCGGSPANPYRVYGDFGKVINGCVGFAHEGSLIPISESNWWHYRDPAIAMRLAELKDLKSLIKQMRSRR